MELEHEELERLELERVELEREEPERVEQESEALEYVELERVELERVEVGTGAESNLDPGVVSEDEKEVVPEVKVAWSDFEDKTGIKFKIKTSVKAEFESELKETKSDTNFGVAEIQAAEIQAVTDALAAWPKPLTSSYSYTTDESAAADAADNTIVKNPAAREAAKSIISLCVRMGLELDGPLLIKALPTSTIESSNLSHPTKEIDSPNVNVSHVRLHIFNLSYFINVNYNS